MLTLPEFVAIAEQKKRNPLIPINGVNVQFIGDPHQGKNFSDRVKPENRGVLEQKQAQLFSKLLNNPDAQEVVIVGDLFEHYLVSLKVMHFIRCELKSCNKEVYVLSGNHDSSKNTNKISSFDFLKAEFDSYHECGLYENIRFVTEATTTKLSNIGLVPWNHTVTCAEQLDSFESSVKMIVTHLDGESYGDSNRNTIPYDLIQQKGIWAVINGHEHKPRVDILVKPSHLVVYHVGSMMPYAHLEGLADEAGFITLTSEQLKTTPKETLENSIVRLRLVEGETIPEVSCLGLEVSKVSEDALDMEASLDLDPSDLKQLFNASMDKHAVSPLSKEQAWEVLSSNHSTGD